MPEGDMDDKDSVLKKVETDIKDAAKAVEEAGCDCPGRGRSTEAPG
jgi:hypothetical protein